MTVIRDNIDAAGKIFADIRTAIENKGITISECDGPATYPSYIESIVGSDLSNEKSILTILAYKVSDSTPDTPTGGSWTVDTVVSSTDVVGSSNTSRIAITYPEGWTNGSGITGSCWLSAAAMSKDGSIASSWSVPVKISGVGSSMAIKTAFAFRVSEDKPAKPLDNTGSYNEILDQVTYPSGWSGSSDLTGSPIWMIIGTFTSTGSSWTDPIKITGKDGINGADSKDQEFIYKLSTTESTKPSSPTDNSNVSGYVPSGWTNHPTGISETFTCEWVCVRIYNESTMIWGSWIGPILWSKYGTNGMDGDGSEYIFRRYAAELTASEIISNNPTPSDWETNTSYQSTTEEYIPTNWTDSPTGADISTRFEYVCIRKFDGSTGKWGRFSNPSVWSRYLQGEPGADGSKLEYIYKLAKNTNAYNITTNPYGKPSVPSTNIKNQDDYIPTGWTDSPTGIDSVNRYEYVCIRKKDSDETLWGDWIGPVLWSAYGDNGMDGDGVQYIYTWTLRNVTSVATPWRSQNQNAYLEWFAVTNQNGTIEDTNWTDDPVELSETHPKIWVSIIRRINGVWETNWSTPTVWSEKGRDGEDGDLFEYAYFRTTTNIAPSVYYKFSTEIIGPTHNYYDDYDNWTATEKTEYQVSEYLPYTDAAGTIPWTDNPQGVTSTLKYEWRIGRKKTGTLEERKWSLFDTPVLSCTFGTNGVDGDYIQYVFHTNTVEIAPTLDLDLTKATTNSDGEVLPYDGNNGYWTDNSSGVTLTNRYEYYSFRKYNGETKTWGTFSTPAIWLRYALDGEAQDGTTPISIYYKGTSVPASIFSTDVIGGTFDKTSSKYSSNGWSFDNPEVSSTESAAGYMVWMTGCYIKNEKFVAGATSKVTGDAAWSALTRITGPGGQAGRDGSEVEYIYMLTDDWTEVPTIQYFFSDNLEETGAYSTWQDAHKIAYQTTDYFPTWVDVDNASAKKVWTDHPTGISSTNRCEWMAMRTKAAGSNVWGLFTNMVRWSTWGKDGNDGDGLQYIFTYNNTGVAPTNPTPSDWETNTNYQSKFDEYVPSGWYDDTITADNTHRYIWVAKRKYDGANQKWLAYCGLITNSPDLFARYGADGAGIQYVYKTTNQSSLTSTDNPTPADWYSNETYQLKYDEYIPSGWTDEPVDVTSTNKYQYVCVRKYDPDTEKWMPFNSTRVVTDATTTPKTYSYTLNAPSLWSTYGTPGTNGTGIQSMTMQYAINGSALTHPDFTNSSVTKYSDFSTALSNAAQGQYIWGRMYILYTNSTSTETYSATYVSKDGKATFKSTVFLRSNAKQVDTPAGGKYDTPVPTSSPTWTDAIPSGDAILWASTRIFTIDGSSPQQSYWSAPRQLTNTSNFEIIFSENTSPSSPYGHPNTTVGWSSSSSVNSIWMATASYANGVWENWQVSKIKGESGTNGQSSFKSTVFTRKDTTPTTPSATGDYANPVPTDTNQVWTDGIPNGTSILWASTRIFTSDGNSPQAAAWSTPIQMTSTSSVAIRFSSVASPATPVGNPSGISSDWTTTSGDSTIWMATCICENGIWGTWNVSKIKGETGESGSAGMTIVSKTITYIYSNSNTTIPSDSANWRPTPEDALTSIGSSFDANRYFWTKVYIKYSAADSNGKDDSVSYSVSYIPKNGVDGNSVTLLTSLSFVKYIVSTDGNVHPDVSDSGWSTTIPTVPTGQYLWVRTHMEYDTNGDGTSNYSLDQYSVSYVGKDGSNGKDGSTGAVLFYRGLWSATDTYKWNDNQRDYVKYSDTNTYYMVARKGSSFTSTTIPSSDSNNWIQADQIGFLKAGAITADMIDTNSLVVGTNITMANDVITAGNIKAGVIDVGKLNSAGIGGFLFDTQKMSSISKTSSGASILELNGNSGAISIIGENSSCLINSEAISIGNQTGSRINIDSASRSITTYDSSNNVVNTFNGQIMSGTSLIYTDGTTLVSSTTIGETSYAVSGYITEATSYAYKVNSVSGSTTLQNSILASGNIGSNFTLSTSCPFYNVTISFGLICWLQGRLIGRSDDPYSLGMDIYIQKSDSTTPFKYIAINQSKTSLTLYTVKTQLPPGTYQLKYKINYGFNFYIYEGGHSTSTTAIAFGTVVSKIYSLSLAVNATTKITNFYGNGFMIGTGTGNYILGEYDSSTLNTTFNVHSNTSNILEVGANAARISGSNVYINSFSPGDEGKKTYIGLNDADFGYDTNNDTTTWLKGIIYSAGRFGLNYKSYLASSVTGSKTDCIVYCGYDGTSTYTLAPVSSFVNGQILIIRAAPGKTLNVNTYNSEKKIKETSNTDPNYSSGITRSSGKAAILVVSGGFFNEIYW